jgi:hypothetical protein
MIEGTLEAFGAVEMLQLFGRMKLSGTLHIECPQRLIDIRLVHGCIAETRDSARAPVGSVLGRLLVERALVTEEELAQALAQQETAPCPLGALLVERGLVLESDVREVLSRQVANTLIAARFEAHGDFLFITDDRPSHASAIMIDTLAALLEISTPGGECHLAVEMLARGDTVLVRNAGHAVLGRRAPADEDEALVFAQVDGRRTVRDLVSESALDAVTVISVLGRLIESGMLLAKVGLGSQDESDAASSTQGPFPWVDAAPSLPADGAEEQIAARDTL